MDFRLARIHMSSGETRLASFDNHKFMLLKNTGGPITAAVGHQVFSAPGAGQQEFGIHEFGARSFAPVLMLNPHPRHLNLTGARRHDAIAYYRRMTLTGPGSFRPLRVVGRTISCIYNALRAG